MKKIIILLLLLALSFISANAQKKLKKSKAYKSVEVMVMDELRQNASLTVVSPNYDPLNIKSALESELMFASSTFKIISESVAKKKKEIINKININDEGINQNIAYDTESVKKLKSLYALEFNYVINGGGRVLSFDGQITNLSDGSILAKFRKKGGSQGWGMSKNKLIEVMILKLNELTK